MILLFTSNNIASKNIAKKLIEQYDFRKTRENEWEKEGVRLIETNVPTVLDIPCDFDTDCLIVLSSHKSKKSEKRLTAHVPGNWGDADFGGEPNTLNIVNSSRLKILLEEIKKEGDKIGWNVSLEVDHHGPTCNVPLLFVEIGSTENEWNDEKAAEAMARAVDASLKRNEKYQAFFGIGGDHYAREFTKIVLETELAPGHMAPKYAIDNVNENTFKQAIEKCTDNVVKVIILKKETNSSQKKRIVELCEKFKIEYEMI